LAAATGRYEYMVRNQHNLTRMLLRQGRREEAVSAARQGLAVAVDHGLVAGERRLRTQLHNLDLLQGRWQEAASGLSTLCDPQQPPTMATSLPLALLGRLWMRQGRPEGVELLERVAPLAARSGEIERMGPVAAGLAEWAWLHQGPRHPLVAAALELAVATGHETYRGEILRYLRRLGEPVEAFPGCPPADAASLGGDWRGAADEWERLGDPYEQALELASSGEEGRLLEAFELLTALDAVPALALVRERLRELGAAAPRGPRAATRRNPFGLTPRQVEVLELLTEGATNAEIAQRLYVSVRTVDHHVAAILRKLEVETRREAAARARKEGVVG
jgi:DNA-binding CsgD family transcriptional regulator